MLLEVPWIWKGESQYTDTYISSVTLFHYGGQDVLYGTKTFFETKVPVTTRAQFHNYITDLHKADGAKQKFAEAWKSYVHANPPKHGRTTQQSMDEKKVSISGLGSSDDEQPAAGAAASAARASKGGEPATQPA